MPKGQDREVAPSEDSRFLTEPEEGNPDESILGDLWDDPGSEEKPEEETDEPEEVSEDEEDEPSEEEEEGQTEPQEPPKMFKIRGKEYTLDDLVKDGLLTDVITQAEQVAHYQELYHAAKQQAEAAVQQPQPQPQPQQPPITVEQALVAMRPHVAQAVKEGYLEPEFVEDYPAAASSQMLIYNDYIQLKRVVTGMYQYFMRENAERMYKGIKDTFDTACTSLVSQHEVYKPLASPDERTKFFEFLSTKVNPEAGAINAEFLASQFLAFQQESILQTMKHGVDSRVKSKKKKRKLAAGETGSTPRKDVQRTQKVTDDEAIMNGMMDFFG